MSSEVDWSAADPHWDAGQLSPAAIGRLIGVSRQAVVKHYDKANRPRGGLAPQIRAQAEGLVQQAAAAGVGEVAPGAAPPPGQAPTTAGTVDMNARIQAQVILDQRADVQRAQRIGAELWQELESQTTDRVAYERLAKLVAKAEEGADLKPADAAQLLAAFRKAGTLPARAETYRKLAEAHKTVLVLQRVVFNIAPDTPIDPTERVAQAVESGIDALAERFAAIDAKHGKKA